MQAAVDITLQVLDMAIDARTAVAYLRRQAMTIFLTCRACFAHSPCIRFHARSFPHQFCWRYGRAIVSIRAFIEANSTHTHAAFKSSGAPQASDHYRR